MPSKTRKARVTEPCSQLSDKLKEHNTITMCPHCKQVFDVHVGMVFLEGKQTTTPPKDTHAFFEAMMATQNKA